METEDDARLDFQYCLNLPYRSCGYCPKTPAVYVIYVSPCIVLYVGRTSTLRTRALAHRPIFSGVSRARIAWFPLPKQFHEEAERRLIEAYRPALNKRMVPAGGFRRISRKSRSINRFIQKQLAS